MGPTSGEEVVQMTSLVLSVSCMSLITPPRGERADDRSAIELLLEEGTFKPARSVVLAFGMDEETGGKVVRPPTPAFLYADMTGSDEPRYLARREIWKRFCRHVG
jgi:hypothetical protein